MAGVIWEDNPYQETPQTHFRFLRKRYIVRRINGKKAMPSAMNKNADIPPKATTLPFSADTTIAIRRPIASKNAKHPSQPSPICFAALYCCSSWREPLRLSNLLVMARSSSHLFMKTHHRAFFRPCQTLANMALLSCTDQIREHSDLDYKLY